MESLLLKGLSQGFKSFERKNTSNENMEAPGSGSDLYKFHNLHLWTGTMELL